VCRRTRLRLWRGRCIVGDIPAVRSFPGLVVAGSGGGLAVNVNGTTPPAQWPAGYIPTVGDAVRVWMLDGTAQVIGPVISGQRPGEGTVSGAASSGKVPVSTSVGTVQARYSGTAPSVGQLVFLDWQMTTPRILAGVAAVTPAPEPEPDPAPPPPPKPKTGTSKYSAVDSRTYQVGSGWGFRGMSVVQWRYQSGLRENRGAWFYGNAPTQLGGRDVYGLRIRVGARQRIGSYNSALQAHFYLTSNRTRPGGDTTRVGGPVSANIPANATPRWYTLPHAWGQYIADNGGGIAIVGAPYLGFNGIDVDPASGQLAFDWRK
jgi:hypothetical protein